jgi:SAM-dependent methyltransferase
MYLIKYDQIPALTGHNSISTHSWAPIKEIYDKITENHDLLNYKNVLNVGGNSGTKFQPSTHIIDIVKNDEKNVYKVDIDFDRFPFSDKFFQYCVCRHTLEDIQNPLHAFQEIKRVSYSGFIETPSPLAEICKVDGGNPSYRGYIHHRYYVWSELENNTLYFLPKYPHTEHFLFPLETKYNEILNNNPVYWNNYYEWSADNNANIFLYRHGVNMDINNDYINILTRAVRKSIEYTNAFISNLFK